jgi:hypothetical protein
MIGESIRRGVEWLLAEFSGSRLRNGENVDPDNFAGRNALAAYALLHAGQALNDPRLKPQSETMAGILERLKEFPMTGQKATYSRSLRLSALGVYQRSADKSAIEQDAAWLLKSGVKGAFTYSSVPEEVRTAPNPWAGWDNSNSQYGMLGLWAAAESMVRVPNVFWTEVERHWVDSQTHTGAWGYGPGAQGGNLALTAAGINALLVARDQLIANGSELPPSSEAPKSLRRALEWMDEGANALNIEGGHPGYTLYGLERAGLASGYKFFGSHDWYLELAARVIKSQQKDGSWVGGDGTPVETAFTILFLSRGRHPVFFAKLQFDGNWATYPRDVANLTRFASQQLERPLNWQTVSLDRGWEDWTDSPVIYIATDKPPELQDPVIDKLRSYCEAGGILFTHADNATPATNAFAESMARRLYPSYPYEKLRDDHPIYTAHYPMKTRPPLMGVSNGARLLMVHSTTDLARFWQKRNAKLKPDAFEMGVNVAIYGSGRRELRNRAESLVIPPSPDPVVGTVPVARVKYNGNWDPEPGAWPRFARAFERDTRIGVKLVPVNAADLKVETAPLAVMTGTEAAQLSDPDLDALRLFVHKGGVLFIDAAGGSRALAEKIRSEVLRKLVPSGAPAPLRPDHPILAGSIEGMEKALSLKARTFAVQLLGETEPPPITTIALGQGHILFSELDVTSGLLGTSTWGIVGYLPATSQAIAKNIVIWSMRPPPR